jgi:hypothetical protein
MSFVLCRRLKRWDLHETGDIQVGDYSDSDKNADLAGCASVVFFSAQLSTVSAKRVQFIPFEGLLGYGIHLGG